MWKIYYVAIFWETISSIQGIGLVVVNFLIANLKSNNFEIILLRLVFLLPKTPTRESA